MELNSKTMWQKIRYLKKIIFFVLGTMMRQMTLAYCATSKQPILHDIQTVGKRITLHRSMQAELDRTTCTVV